MFLTAAALSVATPPDRWVPVGGRADLYEEYLDTQSVMRTGDKVMLWTRRDFALGKGTAWMEIEMNCSTRTETIVAWIRDEGGSVSHNVVRPHREAAPIPPKSSAEKIFQIACR
jgi:hypothetical protein